MDYLSSEIAKKNFDAMLGINSIDFHNIPAMHNYTVFSDEQNQKIIDDLKQKIGEKKFKRLSKNAKKLAKVDKNKLEDSVKHLTSLKKKNPKAVYLLSHLNESIGRENIIQLRKSFERRYGKGKDFNKQLVISDYKQLVNNSDIVEIRVKDAGVRKVIADIKKNMGNKEYNKFLKELNAQYKSNPKKLFDDLKIIYEQNKKNINVETSNITSALKSMVQNIFEIVKEYRFTSGLLAGAIVGLSGLFSIMGFFMSSALLLWQGIVWLAPYAITAVSIMAIDKILVKYYEWIIANRIPVIARIGGLVAIASLVFIILSLPLQLFGLITIAAYTYIYAALGVIIPTTLIYIMYVLARY